MGFASDLMKAVDFAAKKHKDQRRLDPFGTPYINHPIGVAHILSGEAGIEDLAVLQAALLHDTVEDTETTFDEIEANFGREVRDIVVEVTDDKDLPKLERKRLQIVTAAKKMHKSKLVKLADKLYNIRDLLVAPPVDWPEERIQGYFVWASQVISELKGTNEILEAKLADELAKRGVKIPEKKLSSGDQI
jgi:guanosine-3',5'-bis(diphosphate) 3'-pyrophosphohydrolase